LPEEKQKKRLTACSLVDFSQEKKMKKLDNAMAKNLVVFIKLFNNAYNGTSVNVLDSDKLEPWGICDKKLDTAFGRNLDYKGTKFWAGLGIKTDNTIEGFFVYFKRGTFSPSEKKGTCIPLPKTELDNFLKSRKIKILQDFISKVLVDKLP
jgi:hypothetical protein